MSIPKVQLLKLIEDHDATPYIISDNWAMSQKIDGHRVLIECDNGVVKGYNRQRVERDLPHQVVSMLSKSTKRFVFDGELLGNTYWVFDVLEIPDTDITHWSWFDRNQTMQLLIGSINDKHIKLVKHYFAYEEKKKFFDRCQSSGVEGVVFNSLVAPYGNGSTNGALKLKFLADVDCIVIDANVDDRENLVLAVYRNEELFPCGKVSALTGDGSRIKVGDVVQVSCLYSTEKGRLFQPRTPRIRTDKSPSECTFDQIESIKLNKKVLA
jgi:bifunctional non-homologous end joining protein LigD